MVLIGFVGTFKDNSFFLIFVTQLLQKLVYYSVHLKCSEIANFRT